MLYSCINYTVGRCVRFPRRRRPEIARPQLVANVHSDGQQSGYGRTRTDDRASERVRQIYYSRPLTSLDWIGLQRSGRAIDAAPIVYKWQIAVATLYAAIAWTDRQTDSTACVVGEEKKERGKHESQGDSGRGRRLLSWRESKKDRLTFWTVEDFQM